MAAALSPDIPAILPCASCGRTPTTIEVSRPEGRVADIFRVVCECGCASSMRWSVSRAAAVRLWNQHMADNVDD
jgi:hypothetical protein